MGEMVKADLELCIGLTNGTNGGIDIQKVSYSLTRSAANFLSELSVHLCTCESNCHHHSTGNLHSLHL
jgi:hypothetical protein